MNIGKLSTRLIVSVIAGIATAMALSIITRQILHLAGIFPKIGKPEFETNLLLISLGYHSVYALIAAAVTAHIARERARKANFILGTKEAIMWVLGTLLLWKHAAPWYNFTKALLGIPLAMLGGKLYAMYKQYKEQHKKGDLLVHKKTMLRHYHKRISSNHHKIIKPNFF